MSVSFLQIENVKRPKDAFCLEKVYKSRLITTCLRIDLLHIDKLYTRISKCKYDLYNLRKEVNLEYVSVGGVVSCKDDEVRKQLEEKETKHNIDIAELRSSVDDIVANRVKLITLELKQWKSRRGRDYLTKTKLKRQKRGSLVIVGELKNTLSLYKFGKEAGYVTFIRLKNFSKS